MGPSPPINPPPPVIAAQDTVECVQNILLFQQEPPTPGGKR